MILFDLLCSQGHTFEAWFRDSASFDRLASVGEIQCAICGDRTIKKALMAPTVRTSAARPDPVQAKDQASDRQAQPETPSTDEARHGAEKPVPAHVADQTSDVSPVKASSPVPMPEKLVEAMRMVRKMQEHIEKTFDHVGRQFAEEARKMHYGEAEKRSIYGEATQDETEQLIDEGIEINRIPWLPNRNS